MAIQQQSTELTEVQKKLQKSIKKYSESKSSSQQPKPVETKELSEDIKGRIEELQEKLARQIQIKMTENSIKSPFLSISDRFQANKDKKEALLKKLPEPLQTIVRKKDLDLEGLQKLLSVIANKSEQASQKKAKKEGDMVLKDDIQEIIDHYKALDRIQKSEKLRQIGNEKKPTNAELRDFLLSKHTTTLPAEVIDSLLILSNETAEPNLENIEESFKQIENFAEIELSASQNLMDAAKHYAENTLGVKINELNVPGKNKHLRQTVEAFIGLQESLEFQMMTPEQKHMAWAQKFQEITQGLTFNDQLMLFKALNEDCTLYKVTQKMLQESPEDFKIPASTNKDIKQIKREMNFFGDYLRISQRVLAQQPLRSMYQELADLEGKKSPELYDYKEYLKSKKDVSQLMMPDVVKKAVSAPSHSSPLMVASSAPQHQPQFQNTVLKRLSDLNLLKDAFNLTEDLTVQQKTLIETIPGGKKYLQDRELLKNAKESNVFIEAQKTSFYQLFNQNHESFFQAYAAEREDLLNKVNGVRINDEDVELYQQMHQDDCKKLNTLSQRSNDNPVFKQLDEFTQMGADLKNTYNAVVILGDVKPVGLADPASSNQVVGAELKNSTTFIQAPLTSQGIKLHDTARDVTFEVKQIDKGVINFGSDVLTQDEAKKDDLFMSISANILANWTPGKNVVLNVKEEKDALAFYYCMQKMSEHFKQIHKDNYPAEFDRFSMNNVQVRINGNMVNRDYLKTLQQQVQTQESINPFKAKDARLTALNSNIINTMTTDSYRCLQSQRFQNEISTFYSEVISEIDRAKKEGKNLKDVNPLTILEQMKNQGTIDPHIDTRQALQALNKLVDKDFPPESDSEHTSRRSPR
jgi:hypothetical protein